ncbi:uncharacterized protein LOC135844443 [Planococcus citri]|uniref:uncharacterized protein LOC135844443 n=1 Tax=Planococcus citri TaxID=170843 RepID=UPI0031F7B7D1
MNTRLIVLVICEIAFVLADSHTEINQTILSSDAQPTTNSIVASILSNGINSTASQSSENTTSISSQQIANTSHVVGTTTSLLTTATVPTTSIPITKNSTPIITTNSTITSTIIITSTTYTNASNSSFSSTTSSTSTSSSSPCSPTSSNDNWHLTKILTKKGIDLSNHDDKSVQIATPDDGDFQSFIQDSSLWVDKSLLIRKLWEGLQDRNVIITAPPKWGKTISLSMFKFYCELSLDADGFETPKSQSASHLYFNEGKVVLKNGTIQELDRLPLISGFDEHLGDHPVIFMSGVNLTMENILESLRMMIHQTYKRHKCLLTRLYTELGNANDQGKPLVQEDIEEFRAFYDLEKTMVLNESHVVRGIHHLSEILHKVYKKKVAILFDDYEYFVYKTYFTDRPSNFTNSSSNFATIWDSFISHTFEENEHLEKAILTGAIRAYDPKTVLGSLNYYRAYVFDVEDLFPYYGIFENEFLEMARLRGIDKHTIKNATQWYGGYRTRSHLNVQMYSPHSTTRFISTLQIQNYWPNSLLSDFVQKLIQKPKLRQRTCNLANDYVKNETCPAGIFPKYFNGMTSQNYAELQKLAMGQIRYSSVHADIVASVLISSGFAAVHEHNHGPYYIIIRNVPNREVYSQVSRIVNVE